MSMKNQRPLFISSAAIIGLTIASLFGLHLIVDRISKMSPPSIAMMGQQPGARPTGIDDSLAKPPMPNENGMPPPDYRRGKDADRQFKPKMPEPQGRDDSFRRVRNGKDSPDIRRTQPPASSNGKDDANLRGQRGMPGQPPPDMGHYPPPPFFNPNDIQDPKERERVLEEIQQMQKMYPNGPPPGYYPPPGPPPEPYNNGGYDDSYDYGQDYYPEEYDPDYYDDLDSKLENKDHDANKTADLNEIHEAPLHIGSDTEIEASEDYIVDEEDD